MRFCKSLFALVVVRALRHTHTYTHTDHMMLFDKIGHKVSNVWKELL